MRWFLKWKWQNIFCRRWWNKFLKKTQRSTVRVNNLCKVRKPTSYIPPNHPEYAPFTRVIGTILVTGTPALLTRSAVAELFRLMIDGVHIELGLQRAMGMERFQRVQVEAFDHQEKSIAIVVISNKFDLTSRGPWPVRSNGDGNRIWHPYGHCRCSDKSNSIYSYIVCSQLRKMLLGLYF